MIILIFLYQQDEKKRKLDEVKSEQTTNKDKTLSQSDSFSKVFAITHILYTYSKINDHWKIFKWH